MFTTNMKKALLILVLLVFFTASAYAESINTIIDVSADGTTKVTQNLIINSLNINKGFSFPAIEAELAEITDQQGKLKFAIINDSFLIQPRKRSATYPITITYLTNSLTKKDKNTWELNYFTSYKTPIIFSFPEYTKIIESSENSVIYSENGQIKLGWKLAANSNTKIVYENNMNIDPIDIYKIISYSLIAIILLSLLIFCIKKGYCKIKHKLSKEKTDILNTLDKQEKEVIKFLIKNQAYQSVIQKETGISKATLSRVIKRLETKNLIEVRPSGNANLILLTEWFMKK